MVVLTPPPPFIPLFNQPPPTHQSQFVVEKYKVGFDVLALSKNLPKKVMLRLFWGDRSKKISCNKIWERGVPPLLFFLMYLS